MVTSDTMVHSMLDYAADPALRISFSKELS